MKNILLLCFCLIPFVSFSQKKHKGTPVKKIDNIVQNQCNTYVYDLSTDDRTLKNMCFSVIFDKRIDGDRLTGRAEIYRFKIEIYDLDKGIQLSKDLPFTVYEDSDAVTQYHCTSLNNVVAVIFNKKTNSWQILMLDNSIYRMLSKYPSYHFVNAFDIQPKASSSGIWDR